MSWRAWRKRPRVGALRVLAFVLLLVAAGFATAQGAQDTQEREGAATDAEPASRRLLVIGDTGTGENARRNSESAVREGARGIVGVGDYDYDGAPDVWRAMFESHTRNGSFLTLGNHDRFSAYADLFPNGSRWWSVRIEGARVVGMDTESPMGLGTAQGAFVRSALCDAPEDVRILVMHKPWWLETSARHPGSEFPGSPSAMDSLVRTCGVDLVLAGHEHNYQRLVRNGAHYVVAGMGGQSLYPVKGAPPDTVASHAAYGRVLLDVGEGTWQAEFRTLDGTVLDAFPREAGFSAGFQPRNGNEWWVQVRVTANRPLAGVDARVHGGAWHALELKSWGDWAASFHAPHDSRLQFRARSHDGDTVFSGHYRWPSGEPADAPPPPGEQGPSPGFAPRFHNARGNTWWLEVEVLADRPLARVDASVDEGPWLALQKRSWGSWAASHHAPDGSLVRFRATASDGAVASSDAYRWPEATPVDATAPPPSEGDAGDGDGTSPFDAMFHDARGNAWWLEVEVDATKRLAGVDARVDGGPWRALQERSWGSWAASYHAPEGSMVEFRARAATGETDVSSAYRWA